jgi:hypothetical protein
MKYAVYYFSIFILILIKFSEGIISEENIKIQKNESQHVDLNSNFIVERYDAFYFFY